MKVIMVLIAMLLSTSCSAGLIDNAPIGQSFDETKKKYNPQKASCDDEVAKACSEKKLNCTCYEARLDFSRNKSRMLYITVSDNKIIYWSDNRNALEGMMEGYFPKVKEFSGDHKPDLIFEGGASSHYKIYAAGWNIKDVFYFINMTCPLEKYGGKLEMKTPLRNCLVRAFTASTAVDTIKTLGPSWKKSSASY